MARRDDGRVDRNDWLNMMFDMIALVRRSLFIGAFFVIGLAPAWSQKIPNDIFGSWTAVSIARNSPDELLVSLKQDKLVVENDIVQEGGVCKILVSGIRVQRIARATTKVLFISGNALCKSEENQVVETNIFLIYSITSTKTEQLYLVDSSGWWNELFRRKSP
jgi:hypothetical protein